MENTLCVYNVQFYSVHDGPGIRTIVFLKGCPLKCEWCCNPESQKITPQLRHIDFRCIGCGNCVESCSSNGVVLSGDKKAIFNYSKCANCADKKCLETCYDNALTVAGKHYSIDKILEIVEKDRDFYKNSGGGVTFSGGEPFFHGEKFIKLLVECKLRGLSTAVETCGYTSWDTLEASIPYVDYFLFDIKIVNSESHRKYTGVDNTLILSNLEKLAAKGGNIIARIPLIPEATDNPQNIAEIIALCKKLKIKEVNLEIFHNLGEAKYNEYGIKYRFNGEIRSKEFYLNIYQQFVDAGLNVS